MEVVNLQFNVNMTRVKSEICFLFNIFLSGNSSWIILRCASQAN